MRVKNALQHTEKAHLIVDGFIHKPYNDGMR